MSEVSYKLENYKCTVIKKSTDGELHVEFKYDDGDEKSYKFKDPRDTLHFLTNNWSLLEIVEVETLFEYVEYGSHLKIYTPMDFYYLLMLEVIITYLVKYPMTGYGKGVNEVSGVETSNVINSYNNTGMIIYKNKLKAVVRFSHLYAVANAWNVYNQRTTLDIPSPEMVSLNKDDIVIINNDDIIDITHFNCYSYISRVKYKNGKYLLITEVDGIYYKLSNYNSCKIKPNKFL